MNIELHWTHNPETLSFQLTLDNAQSVAQGRPSNTVTIEQ